MVRAVAAALLMLGAAHYVAAWKDPNCRDVVVGESNTLGVVGEQKPMQTVDHTEQWRQYGQITKLNLYYSWNFGCLQGIKATYGYKAGNALMVGHEKNLYTQHIELGDYEHVVKADWRQQQSKCIEFIKLYTNKGKSLTFGNRKSTALFQTVAAPVGGWLAALKGEHDIEKKDGKQVPGGLQNLIFVWAKEKCEGDSTGSPAETPTAEPVPKPTPITTTLGTSPSTDTETTTNPVVGPGTTPGTDTETTTNPVVGPEQPAAPGTTDGTVPATNTPSGTPTTDAPATTAETPLSGPPEDPIVVTGGEVTPGDGVTPGEPVVTPDATLADIPIGISPITPDLPELSEIPVDVNLIAPPGAPGLWGGDTPVVTPTPGPVGPPVSLPAGAAVDGSTVCPPTPSMCSEEALPGTSAFCPVTSPFTKARCEGGCCFSSGKCKMPLCKLNGLGADVMALDFICYGKNNGPFGGFNKCRNLACKLAKPGCQSSLLGGNCVGTVIAANDNLNEMAKQYIGKPCIEVVNHPGPLLHMPLNKPGLPVPNGEYMGSLWTVCDCYAQPSPVLPAVPCFDLKKHLLGKMHPMFAALVAGMGNDSCQGPLCALLPQLPVLNTSLPEIQIPMTLLANLTAMLKPQLLPDVAPLAGLIPAIQLPEIQIRTIPLTLPDLPTFEDCVSYFVNITTALKPAIEAVLPTPLSKPDLVHLVSSLLPQMQFEAPQIDIVAEVPKVALPNLVGLVRAALPKLAQLPQFAVNFPQLMRLPDETRVTLDASHSASQQS